MSIERERNESTENLIEQLRTEILIESNKPISEMDADFIDECVDYLMELENGKELTPEQISTAKEKFMQSVESKYPEKHQGKKFRLKPLLIAACIAIILIIPSVATIAFDSNPDSIMLQFIRYKVSELRGGEAVEYMGNEIIKIPESPEEQILPLEKFLMQNKGFLYPSDLPNDILVTEVICGKLFDSQNKCYTEYDEIIYVTSDVNAVSISATNNPTLAEEVLTYDTALETINGLDCYILVFDSGVAQSYIIHKNYVYTINAKNYDVIIETIKGLKEN